MKQIIKKFESAEKITFAYKFFLWLNFNICAINSRVWKPEYLLFKYDRTDYDAIILKYLATELIEIDPIPTLELIDQDFRHKYIEQEELEELLAAFKKLVPNFIVCREKKDRVFEVIEYQNHKLVRNETKSGFSITAALIKSTTIMKCLKK